VTAALLAAWARLQKNCSLNYSNPVTAAFNYNTQAGKRQQETDKRRDDEFGDAKERNADIEMLWGGEKSQTRLI